MTVAVIMKLKNRSPSSGLNDRAVTINDYSMGVMLSGLRALKGLVESIIVARGA